MLDAEDPHRVPLKGEQNPVVPMTEPEASSQIAVQTGQVASSGASEMEDCFKDPHGCLAVQTAYISLGTIEPDDSIRRTGDWRRSIRHYGSRSGKSSGFKPNSVSTSSMGVP